MVAGDRLTPSHDIAVGLPDKVPDHSMQPEPDGTGGAVRAALPLIEEVETVLVLSGDVPLLSGEVISDLLGAHAASDARRDDADD